MYGEAAAVALMAKAVGNTTLASQFEAIAAENAGIVLKQHWNEQIQSFSTIPLAQTSGGAGTPSAPSCNLTAVRVVNRTVNVRELLGFMPWYFSGLIPTEAAAKFYPMWKALFDPKALAGPWGLRTAEHRDACYNYSWTHGDCWNGPSWPYETARVRCAFFGRNLHSMVPLDPTHSFLSGVHFSYRLAL
jgi:glycogen debranching enzyme